MTSEQKKAAQAASQLHRTLVRLSDLRDRVEDNDIDLKSVALELQKIEKSANAIKWYMD
jgi:hypothetical protein|tara:strand:- start:136 stop:312 length:177 start_codon:yes stop_codon:yes gene_type:complete